MCPRRVSRDGPLSFCSVEGKHKQEGKPVPHDIHNPLSEHSSVSWRALGIPCDVTSDVTTPNALRAFNYSLDGSPIFMSARWRRSLLDSENGEL